MHRLLPSEIATQNDAYPDDPPICRMVLVPITRDHPRPITRRLFCVRRPQLKPPGRIHELA